MPNRLAGNGVHDRTIQGETARALGRRRGSILGGRQPNKSNAPDAEKHSAELPRKPGCGSQPQLPVVDTLPLHRFTYFQSLRHDLCRKILTLQVVTRKILIRCGLRAMDSLLVGLASYIPVLECSPARLGMPA